MVGKIFRYVTIFWTSFVCHPCWFFSFFRQRERINKRMIISFVFSLVQMSIVSDQCRERHQSTVHFLAILGTFYSLVSLLMVTGEEYHDWSYAPRWNVNVATVCPHCPQATRDHTGAGGTFSHNFTLGLSPE